MRETLPGNPTESGPESRNEPPMTWQELMQQAEEECFFGRRRHDPNTKEGKRLLLKSIFDAREFLISAEEVIRGE